MDQIRNTVLPYLNATVIEDDGEFQDDPNWSNNDSGDSGDKKRDINIKNPNSIGERWFYGCWRRYQHLGN